MVLRTRSKEKKTQAFKSGKQRRAEILTRRKKNKPVVEWIDPESQPENWPKGAVAANRLGLELLHPYSLIPHYYADKPFKCRDCGVEQVWRATQQKWYYEVAKGKSGSTAVRCLPCRRKERERKAKARADSLPGLLAKQKKAE
jgi:hypothetical protein